MMSYPICGYTHSPLSASSSSCSFSSSIAPLSSSSPASASPFFWSSSDSLRGSYPEPLLPPSLYRNPYRPDCRSGYVTDSNPYYPPLQGSSLSSTTTDRGGGLGPRESPSSPYPSAMGVGQQAKLCGVCGDKALGYNFDAITCESCKAFFRRNAPKGLEHFKCCYDGQCPMTLCNRRVCKRCRLSKCFLIGMRREYILTEEERLKKRQKIDENRMRRTEVDKVRSPPSNSQGVSSQSQVTSETTALNVEDASAIEELVSAYRESLRVNVDADPPRQHAANLSDLVNIAELSVRRVIAMAKRLQCFRLISYQDQIHLLKGGSIELLILRSVLTFDKDKQHFLDPLDEEETKALKIDQLKDAETGTGLFEQHMKFVRSLTLDLNVDETSMILLLVIALFSPDRENLSDRRLVAEQQEWHCQLLKKHLESIHQPAIARSLFPKMLLKLADVRNLNEEHSLVLLKVNPDGIQPLMQEFLDLRC